MIDQSLCPSDNSDCIAHDKRGSRQSPHIRHGLFGLMSGGGTHGIKFINHAATHDFGGAL